MSDTSATLNPAEFGSELVVALGLQDRDIRSIDFCMDAGQQPSLRIVEYIKRPAANNFITLIRTFGLTPEMSETDMRYPKALEALAQAEVALRLLDDLLRAQNELQIAMKADPDQPLSWQPALFSIHKVADQLVLGSPRVLQQIQLILNRP